MEIWKVSQQQTAFAGLGDQGVLALPLQAFFASRHCPGTAIRAGMDWALEQGRNSQPVVSGFHSPLEQSVLTLLLQARCPVVAVLARPVAGARLRPEWAEPLAQGRMVAMSAATSSGRLTEELADLRNHWAAQWARQIVVAHASQGGRLDALCEKWNAEGKVVTRLA